MRILFIEDNAADVELYTTFLKRQLRDAQIEPCPTVADAARHLAGTRRADYDLILADLNLPDGSGLDILTILADGRVALPVIVLIGSGDETTTIAALKAGAADYIRKGAAGLHQLPGMILRAIEEHRRTGPIRLKSIRVLYVDDDKQDIDLTRRHLARHARHISVEQIGDAEAALEQLGRPGAEKRYDVLMLDYRLPGMTGLELLKDVRFRLKLKVPAIIVTGAGDEEVAVESLRLGAASYIRKDAGYLIRLPAEIERAFLLGVSTREQEELRLREKAIEAAANGIVITDPNQDDNPVIYANAAFERMTGYERSEILGRNCRFLQGRRKNQPGLGILRDAIARGEGAHVELQNFRKDGTPYRAEIVTTPVRDPGGNLTHFVGIIEDISDRKRKEEALRLTAKVFENSNEAMFICDSRHRVTRINNAYCKITGHTEDEVIGRQSGILDSAAKDAGASTSFWRNLRVKGNWSGESYARRKDGSQYPIWLNVTVDYDEFQKATHYIGWFSDISQLKESQERLQYLANYDNLTGLLNRSLFYDRLINSIERAKRREHRMAVLFIDLDNFKVVNDTLGHQAGDALLTITAERLRRAVRSADSVCRIGGDEFMILLSTLEGPDQAARTAARIIEAMSVQTRVEGYTIVPSASVGISLYPDDASDADTLIRKADMAMFKGKEQGRGRYQFFTEQMNAEVYDRLLIEQDLRRALERNELFLEYQPRVLIADWKLAGLEALARWRHPEKGLISPAKFIAVAEMTGLILPIGEWIIRTVVLQLKEWRDAGIPPTHVSINLSPVQFRRQDIDTMIQRIIDEAGVSPNWLGVEITETAVMEQGDLSVSTLQRLKEIGLTIAIDDFGVGYSSLSYLKRFPVDDLKIDRSFISGIIEDETDTALVTAIMVLAHSLGLSVIAEG
ncbi:MAG: EAL domain-containing protein, partial [Gammaproteobacteria bacterium]|nr:EAL domain-containing protein [Gammaproteobacteria bacterium]